MASSLDFNNPKYPYVEDPDVETESHEEPHHGGIQSNEKDASHPFFSPDGIKDFINHGRAFANSFSEKQLTGTVKDKVVYDIMTATRQLKIPVDILIAAVDWKQDLDKRTAASDAKEIGNKMKNYIPELRNLFSRDPLNAEVFAAYVLGSSSKVKALIDKAENTPEEKASPPGTSKDDIITKKNRNSSAKDRTNREVLDYFYKRVVNGKVPFLDYMSYNNG